MIIVGKECFNDGGMCKYCTVVNEDDPKNIGVCCSAKDNKFFRYGQCIPCEDKEIRNDK